MIIHDLPIDEYHKSHHLSSTKIKTFLSDGPERYYRQYVKRDLVQEDTPAFRFGRIFDDKMCLSHAEWEARYVLKPANVDFRTKEGKAWKEAADGREILTADEWILIDEMRSAVLRNPIAEALLFGAKTQVTIRGKLTGSGIDAQSRPDFLQMEAVKPWTRGPAIVDLKTTDDLRNYANKAIDYGYHRQIALGQMLLAAEGVDAEGLLLVVEKKRAPRCRVLRIPETALAKGAEEVIAVGKEIARRASDDDWTERQEGIEELAVSEWRLR